MKTPWVSRDLYEQTMVGWQSALKMLLDADEGSRKARETIAGLQHVVGERDKLREEVVYLRAQIAAKDELVAALRREGFDPPDPRPPTTHELRAKIDPLILHGIEQIAQPGTKEHFVMLQEAEALIAAYPDRPAEQIADEVTEGSPISPWRL